MFSSHISFNEGGSDGFSTNLGSLVSLIILSLVLIYGQKKFFDLQERSDSMHQEFEEKDGLINTVVNLADVSLGVFYFYPLPPYTDPITDEIVTVTDIEDVFSFKVQVL